MKKTKTMLFAIFLALSSYAQEFIEFISSESTDVICNVLVSDNDKVEFDVVLPGVFSNEVVSCAESGLMRSWTSMMIKQYDSNTAL